MSERFSKGYFWDLARFAGIFEKQIVRRENWKLHLNSFHGFPLLLGGSGEGPLYLEDLSLP